MIPSQIIFMKFPRMIGSFIEDQKEHPDPNDLK